MDQSGDHGLRPLDLPIYEDATAVARDGEKRVAAISFRFVRDPIRATWLQRVNLARQREADTKFLTAIPSTNGTDYSRLAMRPVERVTLTLPEHGVSGQRYEIVKTTLNDDLSLGLELSEDQDGTYGVSLGPDGVRRVDLGLPPIPDRRFEFANAVVVSTLTGFNGGGFAVKQSDGTIINHLTAKWDRNAALFSEVEFRQSGGFGQPASTSTGIQYSATGLRPFTIGASHATADYATSQSQRHGVWLQFQWGPLFNDQSVRGTRTEASARNQGLQMAGGGTGPRNPILGWTGPNGRNLTFWRFGIYSSGNTILGVDEINASNDGITSSRVNLSSDQIANWRIIMRSSGGHDVHDANANDYRRRNRTLRLGRRLGTPNVLDRSERQRLDGRCDDRGHVG